MSSPRPTSFPSNPTAVVSPTRRRTVFTGRGELLELERLMLPKQDARRNTPAPRIASSFCTAGAVRARPRLATEAAHWFVRTRLFERAVFVSFERGGGLELALGEIGNALDQR